MPVSNISLRALCRPVIINIATTHDALHDTFVDVERTSAVKNESASRFRVRFIQVKDVQRFPLKKMLRLDRSNTTRAQYWW